EELVEQLPRIREATKALNIPSFEMEGFEADDIIGTMAKQAESEGLEVWCVTGDKDYFQLVSDHVRIYNPRKASEDAERYGREEVKEKFGVYPELVIDKLALMGDSSDNVPGIPGVGKVSADKLLAQFGSLDAILSGHEQIKAKGLREKVAGNIEMAKLSKELVTIDLAVPIEYTIESMKRSSFDYEACKKLFVELEFPNLMNRIMNAQPAGDETEVQEKSQERETEYKCIASITELKELVDDLSARGEVAVDTETTSLNPFDAKLVGVSLSAETGKAVYIPLGHSAAESANLPFDKAMVLIKSLLENPKVQKFGQNIKYDYEVLRKYDIDINPIGFDTMLASYVLNPSGRQNSLDALALAHFDHQMQPIKDLIGTGKKQKTFDTVEVKQATHYAAEDADFTYRLRTVLAPLVDSRKLQRLLYEIELPLIKVLAAMEEEGIRVDREFLSKLSVEMDGKLANIIAEIYSVAGSEFNINSTQQLSHILFEKLGLPTGRKTAKKTGYSTDQRVLEELAGLHSFPKLILDYRQHAKLKSTYIDALPRLISERDGRVHTSFNQTIAATGRLSSTDPNLQNIPIRTEDGRRIRKAFVPRDKDHLLLAADYSQVELRILAHYSEDASLIEAFKRGDDIHARTAAEVHRVELEDVTPEMRAVAKTANFAVIYGVSAFGLSQQTELAVDESRQFIDTYFERYPGIRRYMDDTIEFARKEGYVTTLFGRRRYIPEINDSKRTVRQFAERVAINSPVQGTAADIIKIAMIKIHERLAGMRSKMVLQVHDELVFDVHKEESDELIPIVRNGMEKAAKLRVPLTADIGSGQNWLDCK
ncbi:MAG: DNA polymerase I, partial [candidate division Zixibacteria bacterium]